MAKAQTAIRFTYEDYKSLPESETRRYELLEGELVVIPSPSFEHQEASRNLALRLWAFVSEKGLGIVLYAPFAVVLGEPGAEHVVQPDILFVSRARQRIIRPEEVRGAPDLIVEILSPSTERRDRELKRKLYAKQGVQEYWLVDPYAQTIEVLTLGRRGYRRAGLYTKAGTLKSSLLPGLRIALREIF